MSDTKLIDWQELTEEECIMQFESLIWKIVRKFPTAKKGKFLEPEDLFNVGAIGLINAYRRFDTSKKLRFSTYAFPYVQGYLQRFMSEKENAIKLGIPAMNLFTKLKKEDKLHLSIEEVSQHYGVTLYIAEKALSNEKSIYSLDLEVDKGEDANTSLYGIIYRDEDMSSLYVEEFIQTLTKQRQFIVRRLMAEDTKAEIARALGVNHSRVSFLVKEIQNQYTRFQNGGEENGVEHNNQGVCHVS
ncbi:sigma-70 family RNA polymerase sigma factor [Terribacillus saccharophilus]|uniref:sigma-70 family RNA polymerase sigma factor n=1 Tax=Terribacillus saccharophilus TaxID=361277 RepID=UPI003982D6D1